MTKESNCTVCGVTLRIRRYPVVTLTTQVEIGAVRVRLKDDPSRFSKEVVPQCFQTISEYVQFLDIPKGRVVEILVNEDTIIDPEFHANHFHLDNNE